MTTALQDRRHSCGYLLTAPSHAGQCRDDWGQYTPDAITVDQAAELGAHADSPAMAAASMPGPNAPRRWGDSTWASQRYAELTATDSQRGRIRAWGKRHGITVNGRGRLPVGLVRAYDLDDPAEF
jgi:hypothetical protein